MQKLALCVLLTATAATAQDNPFLRGIEQGIQMRQQIEAARLLRQEQRNLEEQRALIRAEQERLRAETELLREQLRQMKKGGQPETATIDIEEQRRFIREAVARLVVRHGDVEEYADTIQELNAYLLTKGRSPDAFYYDIYFQGLYLLARYFDENYPADSPDLVPVPEDRLIREKQ